jgi:hypothetical protein
VTGWAGLGLAQPMWAEKNRKIKNRKTEKIKMCMHE